MMWEYMGHQCQPGQELAVAQAAGADGWELCQGFDRILASSPVVGADRVAVTQLVFKRPKLPELLAREIIPDASDSPERIDFLPDSGRVFEAR